MEPISSRSVVSKGKEYGEASAAKSRRAATSESNRAAVLLNDSTRNPQSQARALLSFCRVKRLEKPCAMFRSNPWTVVAYDSPYTSKIRVPAIDEIRYVNAELVASLAQASTALTIRLEKTCLSSPASPLTIPAER